MAVKSGDTVRVHYAGTLADGSEFDSSAGRAPLEFTAGAGQVIPGFDAGVIGMEPGDKKRIEIPVDQAYGDRHQELVYEVPTGDFAEEPYLGGMVNLVAPDGHEMPGEIVKIEDGTVTLDFNHPLAGKDLVFEVELVGIVE